MNELHLKMNAFLIGLTTENEMAECIADGIRQLLFMSNNYVKVFLKKGEDKGTYDFCVIKNKEVV